MVNFILVIKQHKLDSSALVNFHLTSNVLTGYFLEIPKEYEYVWFLLETIGQLVNEQAFESNPTNGKSVFPLAQYARPSKVSESKSGLKIKIN